MDLPEFGGSLREAREKIRRFHLEAEDLAELASDDREAHAIEEAVENRTREKVCDKASAAKAGKNTNDANEHGERHRELEVACGIGARQRHQGRCDHRASRGIRPHHELPARAEESVYDARKNGRIETDDRRKSRELCVSDGGGNLNRSDGEPSDQIRAKIF